MTIVLISENDGLVERIINLVNGIHFSKNQKLKYKINWDTNNCNIDLKNLFTNIKYNKLFYYRKEGDVYNLNHNKIKKIYGDFIFFNSIKDRYLNNKKINLIELKNKNILFNTHQNFIKKEIFSNIFSKFKINYNILRIVKIFNFFKLHKITGVYISKKFFKNINNKFIYIKKYLDYLNSNSIKQIFLCSDDNNMYNKFQKYEVIRYYNRELNKNTQIKLEDYLINLLLLSRCKEIISFKSKFSSCASYIGNNKLKILE